LPVKNLCVLPGFVPMTQLTSGVHVPTFVPELQGTVLVPGAQPWPSGRGKALGPGRIFMSKMDSWCWNETG